MGFFLQINFIEVSGGEGRGRTGSTWATVKDLNGCCNVYTQLKRKQFELFLCKLLSNTNLIRFYMLIFNGEQRDIIVRVCFVFVSGGLGMFNHTDFFVKLEEDMTT